MIYIILLGIIGILTITTFGYKYRSERDGFTDCFNKDWAITKRNSKLVRMMKRASNKGVPFGLAFIDFDDFKQVNDKEGHFYGDRVILDIVKSVKTVLKNKKTKGLTVRFGGDELLVLIPNTYKEELIEVCEAMVQRVKQSIGQTISVGGVIFSKGDDINVEKIIKKADDNLYAAKEKGKDCAVVA